MRRFWAASAAFLIGLSAAWAAVQDYSTNPNNNTAAPPNGAPEGMAPSTVNDTMRQMMTNTVIEAQVNRVKYLNSVAGTNAITASMTPNLTAYSPGMIVVMTPANTNAGATTLNIDSRGALDVQKFDGDALVAGDLVADFPAVLALDAGADDWTLLNPQSANLSNGVAFSDLARRSQSNAFLGMQSAEIAGSATNFALFNTSSLFAEKGFAFRVTINGDLRIDVADGSGSGANTAIAIERTGTTVDSINLQATSVQVNGSQIVVTASTGSFTGTLTGMTATTQATVNYRIVGNVCHLWVTAGFTGTSNSTLMTMTGVPAACIPANTKQVASHVRDNGDLYPGMAEMQSGGTMFFYIYRGLTLDVGSFTASGTKGLGSGWTISYPLG